LSGYARELHGTPEKLAKPSHLSGRVDFAPSGRIPKYRNPARGDGLQP
jgi:hypothetical protein